ncbi:alpha/beta hydrolase-fold protein [Candidatus Riflebacteria bacterium]
MRIFLLLAILYLSLTGVLSAENIRINIQVKVPEYTPDHVFITGNINQLGNWIRHEKKLNKIAKDLFEINLSVPEKEKIQFKFTLGSWASVQKGENNEELPNNIIKAGVNDKYSYQVHNWASLGHEAKSHTRTGNFEFLKKFHSSSMGNTRDILVYLPPSYKEMAKKRYPVLYMHDGNNIFDTVTSFAGVEWEVDEAVQSLIKEGLLAEIIIVGVYNTGSRMHEYTPVKDKKYGGGGGDKYLNFLVYELMPVINKKFRTRTGPENTALMGSSLGGLISLFAAFKYNKFFGQVGVMSPSLWWADCHMLDFVVKQKKNQVRIWLDMGTREGKSALDNARKMNTILQKMKYKHGQDYFYYEHKGAIHNEAFWAQRLHLPLLFFYKVSENQAR